MKEAECNIECGDVSHEKLVAVWKGSAISCMTKENSSPTVLIYWQMKAILIKIQGFRTLELSKGLERAPLLKRKASRSSQLVKV